MFIATLTLAAILLATALYVTFIAVSTGCWADLKKFLRIYRTKNIVISAVPAKKCNACGYDRVGKFCSRCGWDQIGRFCYAKSPVEQMMEAAMKGESIYMPKLFDSAAMYRQVDPDDMRIEIPHRGQVASIGPDGKFRPFKPGDKPAGIVL